MTKVIILGQEPEQEKKKSIEFFQEIGHDLSINPLRYKPMDFQNIELVAKHWDIDDKFDLMFVYDNDRSFGRLVLGHFNDGVVE